MNEELKTLEVTISVSLSKTVLIELPKDVDETDPVALKIAVYDQVMLPQDYPELEDWTVDEMCIV
jgi:hypothetical protein